MKPEKGNGEAVSFPLQCLSLAACLWLVASLQFGRENTLPAHHSRSLKPTPMEQLLAVFPPELEAEIPEPRVLFPF